jgi:hypothetical protein
MATDLSRPDAAVGGLVVLAVFGLYQVACFLPSIDCGPPIVNSSGDVAGSDLLGERGSHAGLELLLVGWCGGNNGVPWSANVFLLLGWACLMLRRLRAGAAFGFIATVLGLTTWWVRRHDTLMVGYYVWQASHFVLAGGALWAIRSSRQLPIHQVPQLEVWNRE